MTAKKMIMRKMEKIISLIGKLCKEEMSIKSVEKKARFNLGAGDSKAAHPEPVASSANYGADFHFFFQLKTNSD